jgi:hypothetical protein
MRRLLLAADEDDAYAWLKRHPHVPAAIVWPGRFKTLTGGPTFDRLAVSAAAWHMPAAIAACLTLVKGPDGLTPGQRLTADGIGQELRELNSSIARHPAGKQRQGTPQPPRMRPE